MSNATITPEARSATLSVRAKLRKALAVNGSAITAADTKKLAAVLKNLDKVLAPAKGAATKKAA